MTKQEKHEIMCYIAQNFISPVYHEGVKKEKPQEKYI